MGGRSLVRLERPFSNGRTKETKGTLLPFITSRRRGWPTEVKGDTQELPPIYKASTVRLVWRLSLCFVTGHHGATPIVMSGDFSSEPLCKTSTCLTRTTIPDPSSLLGHNKDDPSLPDAFLESNSQAFIQRVETIAFGKEVANCLDHFKPLRHGTY